MNKIIKWILIISASFSNLVFGFTSPVVHIYFMGLIDPNFFSMVNFVEAGLSAVVNSILSIDEKRAKFKRYALYFLALDSIAYIIIVALSIEHVYVRFFGLAIANSLLATVWFVMLNDSINKKISGDTLTSFNTLQKSWMLYASLIGAGIGSFFGNQIPIEVALWLQAVTSTIVAFCDGYTFKKLEE